MLSQRATGREIQRQTFVPLRGASAFSSRTSIPWPGWEESGCAFQGFCQVPHFRRNSKETANGCSHHQQSGVKCSIKANEGHLFCLDKSFMFVPKPATYISFDNISMIVMSRVGGAVSASRTFDITITLKGGAGEHQFSNINRYVPLSHSVESTYY